MRWHHLNSYDTATWFESKQCGSMLVSKHFAQTQAQTWGTSLCSNPQGPTLCNFLNQINVMFESCVFGQVKSSTDLTHQCRPARELAEGHFFHLLISKSKPKLSNQVSSEQLPSNFRALPSNFRALPSNFRALPSNFRATSEHFRALPSTSEQLPSTSEHFRATSEHFRALPSNFRATSEHFRALPSTSEQLPSTSEHFRATSEHFRALPSNFRATSKHFQATCRQHPGKIRALLSTFKQLLTKCNPV